MGKLRFRDGKSLAQGHQASMCVVQVKWLRGLQAAELTVGLYLPASETQVLEWRQRAVLLEDLQRLGLELGTPVHKAVQGRNTETAWRGSGKNGGAHGEEEVGRNIYCVRKTIVAMATVLCVFL